MARHAVNHTPPSYDQGRPVSKRALYTALFRQGSRSNINASARVRGGGSLSQPPGCTGADQVHQAPVFSQWKDSCLGLTSG